MEGTSIGTLLSHLQAAAVPTNSRGILEIRLQTAQTTFSLELMEDPVIASGYVLVFRGCLVVRGCELRNAIPFQYGTF